MNRKSRKAKPIKDGTFFFSYAYVLLIMQGISSDILS